MEKKKLNTNDGFTLVELMVTVAIIGLLSAVAIPNFKKYQAKAKIAEAKLQLSALYTAEAGFFSDYGIYHICLSSMGYDPSGERSQRYYTVGFYNGISVINGQAYLSAMNSGIMTDKCGQNPASVSDETYFLAGKSIGTSLVTTMTSINSNRAGDSATAYCNSGDDGLPGSCLGTQANDATMRYQAFAIGYISQDYVTLATASSFNINQDKKFKSVISGY